MRNMIVNILMMNLMHEHSLYRSRDQTNIYGLYPLTRPNRNAHAKYDGEHVDDEFNA